MDGLSIGMATAAVGVAFVHTALGPDHYLPFVALGRARGWSMRRTLSITAVCGVGHVLSSVVLGGLGVLAGVALGALSTVEGHRGDLAAWLLFGIGIAYALWGVRRALRRHEGFELHTHGHGVHLHHGGGVMHVHAHHHHPRDAVRRQTTFWALFLVFVLGPCEPLIPLFMVPASEARWGVALVLALVFGVITLATMLAITAALVAGVSRVPLGPLQRWAHAMAGGVMAASASAVLFLGL
ncbi:MAG: hypothetical protein U1F36_15705 [Planctomycetota bacterium]